MRRYLLFAFILVIFSSNACVSLLEEQRKDYGLLETAVTFSSDKVIGEYGDVIPNDFDSNKFLQLVKDKIPEDYYGVLKKYTINVSPKGSYYLLITYDGNKLILFDYSAHLKLTGRLVGDRKVRFKPFRTL